MRKAPAPKNDLEARGRFLPEGHSYGPANRSISDAGWWVFLARLNTQAASAG
ncbi:hypothetical protein OHB49_44900 (plasmid) [Streptomyces sp. NBC_01717]|uniref:hypothetical protein n=1 Tax=Streptomyces sp. NBC_01717 TaxID=2975918 RepID=UPI002E32D30B|nr:hypothetical protein [Streptomyces sp. NBC_01717]